MFRKVTNADLLSRLVNLENKIDIVSTRMNSQSLEGCCDCKTRETTVYKQLKDYLEEKFSELNSGVLEQLRVNNVNQDLSKYNLQKDIVNVFNDTFDKYKLDIMNNLQTIITNLSISNIQGDGNESFCTTYILDQLRNELTTYRLDTENDMGKILVLYENANRTMDEKLTSVNDFFKKAKEESNEKFVCLDRKLNSLDTKIGSIYFENEIIKHQLKLEDEIRVAIDEVNNLSLIVTSAISQIDSVLNKK